MANIRYSPDTVADEPTGPATSPAIEYFKVFKNVKLSCQIFTPANDHQITRYPKGNHKKYTKVLNSDFFRATVKEGVPQETIYITMLSVRNFCFLPYLQLKAKKIKAKWATKKTVSSHICCTGGAHVVLCGVQHSWQTSCKNWEGGMGTNVCSGKNI